MITLDQIKKILHANKDKWLVGTHQGNDGNQGNTLEGLFGVSENNLKLPDLGDIELKTQKIETGSYITLFHKEPSPRASIPKLLKCLGWQHQEAGNAYPHDEMSFRSTTYAHRFSDRGFTVDLNQDRIEFVFSPNKVNVKARDVTQIYSTYGEWLSDVEQRKPHYSSVLPVYWDRNDFDEVCLKKLNNTLMCYCETRKIGGIEHFKVVEAYIYKQFLKSNLSKLFSEGAVVIDFDARTRHNHGTKLRVKKDKIGELFQFSSQVF
jgi:hypothetical protein